MIGPKGDEDMLRVLLRSSVRCFSSVHACLRGLFSGPLPVSGVCVCVHFPRLQDAGAIIGKSGSNVRELRTKVRGLSLLHTALDGHSHLCLHVWYKCSKYDVIKMAAVCATLS